FCDTDLRRHKKLTKYFFKNASAPLLFASKKGQNSPRFSSSPYQRGGTARVIFFLHLKKQARKSPETIAVSGLSGKLSFLLAQYGCGGRI
ncbi:MAG: hypothetical protein VB086_03225, partial [Clostridiaceae bacterium]|nr:hypothetical protein [Clostridiaceae bacterium]